MTGSSFSAMLLNMVTNQTSALDFFFCLEAATAVNGPDPPHKVYDMRQDKAWGRIRLQLEHKSILVRNQCY